MKNVLITLFMLMIPLLNLPASESSKNTKEDSLTLEKAKLLAIQHNPGITQTLARIRSAKALLGQAYSSWFPTVSVNGGYFYRDMDIQPDWEPDIRVKQNIREATANLELNWLLFNGFARRAETLAAKYGVDEAKKTFADTQRLLLESVATAYYQAQLARENRRVAEKNAEFNRKLEHDAKVRRQIGTASRSEMLNFSIRTVQAESDSIHADKDYTVACTVLAELIGGAGNSIVVVPSFSPGKNIPGDTIPSFDQLLNIALKNRPDLQANEARIQAATQQKNAAKGSWMPSVALSAGLSYTKQTGAEPIQEEHNGYAGISAQWDIFTGGKRSRVFQEKKAAVYAVEAEREQVKRSIASGIRQARASTKAAREQWKRQEKALDMTRQVRHDIERLYKVGSASLTRLNEAQTDLVRAEGLAATSRVQYLLSIEKLRSETGTIAASSSAEKNIASVE